MPKSRKKSDEKSAEIVRFTSYIDSNGDRITIVRCESCKGYGCENCSGYGFLKQGELFSER